MGLSCTCVQIAGVGELSVVLARRQVIDPECTIDDLQKTTRYTFRMSNAFRGIKQSLI